MRERRERGRESEEKLCEWVRVDLGLRRTYETAVDDTCSLYAQGTRHKAQGKRHKAGPCKTAFTFISSHADVSILFFTSTLTFISYKKRSQLQCQSANLRARCCSPLLQSMARLIGRPDTSSTDAFIIASKPPTSFFYVPCKSQAVYFLRRVVEESL